MSDQHLEIQVELMDEEASFSLRDICERSDVHAEFVVKLVSYGVISPVVEGPPQNWRFDAPALSRLQKARRLQRDLKLNLPGVAMSLDLLDDLTDMRRQVARLEQRLQQMLDDEY